MHGRRGYQRMEVDGGQGVLRVLRDVVVQPTDSNEWVAVGREAGVVGEVLTLDRNDHQCEPSLRVRVSESQPVIVRGTVRHRIRLERLPGGTRG
jgi:hypothetical protein